MCRTILSVINGLAAMLICSASTAQVVQLPSYRNFSYTGGAWVPDAGTASLAGSGYGVSGASSRGWGPYSGGAGGSSVGGNSLTARVQILDLAAMDEALMRSAKGNANGTSTSAANVINAAAARRGLFDVSAPVASNVDPGPDPLAWHKALDGAPQDSVNSDAQRESDVRYYLRLGKDAENANRLQSARVYYRLAQRTMTPAMLKAYQQVLAERKAAEEALKLKNDPSRIKF